MKTLTGRRRLFLMRHGHVDYFASEVTDFRQVSLTAEGEEQARAAGQALAAVEFDKVWHSGLPRTAETAALVLENNHETDRRSVSASAVAAMEELRGGVYVTDSREELAARLAFSFEEAASENAEFLPGGERFTDAYDRIVAGFRSLVLEQNWRTGLLVAHEGVNRLLLAHLCHAGLAGVAAFEQDLACINVLDIDVVATGQDLKIQRALIRAMNVTAYDYVKAGLPKSSLEHLFDIDFNGQRPHAREMPRR